MIYSIRGVCVYVVAAVPADSVVEMNIEYNTIV